MTPEKFDWAGNEKQVGLRRVGAGQQRLEPWPIDPQIGDSERRVVHARALRPRELADPVDRVVVVEGRKKPPASSERVGFADFLQRAGGVGREDGRVRAGVGAEPGEHQAARLFHEPCGGRGAEAARVRVAEDVSAEEVRVLANLGDGMETPAGVVQVDVPLGVEAGIFQGPKLVERGRTPVGGMLFQELFEGPHRAIVTCFVA